MAKRNVVEQGTFSKQDVAVVEKFAGMLGQGLAFLVHAGVEVGMDCRAKFVALAEKNPQVAERLIGFWENVETARINAEVKAQELGTGLVGKMVDGTFSVLNTVASKVDFNQLISHGIQHDLVLQQARLKEAEAELLRAQTEATREARFSSRSAA